MSELQILQKKYPHLTLEELAAFTYSGLGGNMAGVVIDLENSLSYEEMQLISKTFNHSESAFVQQSDIADFKVLFFTPTNRVKMCGHATIATWGALQQNEFVKPGNYTQEIINEDSVSQILKIEVTNDRNIFTDLDLPKLPEGVDRTELNNYLNYGEHSLPLEIVNTGFKDLMIPVTKAVFDKIDYAMIEKDLLLNIQKKFNVEGLHMFYFENINNELKIFAKNTDPINGIYPYDDATGTTNGALAAYLYFNKVISKEKLEEGIFVIQIGKANKQSKVIIKFIFDNNKISQIKVGGEYK